MPATSPVRQRESDYQRRRALIACDVCRARRTRCDGRRPKCSFCARHNGDCVYRERPSSPPTRLERELSLIGQRLDQLTALVSSDRQATQASRVQVQDRIAQNHLPQETHPAPEFPFMTVKTPSLMELLGLDRDLAARLVDHEQHAAWQFPPSEASFLFVLQYQHAIDTLNRFSDHVHIWYPILHSTFRNEFSQSIAGSFPPSSDSCLALLVIAIGSLFADDDGASQEEAKRQIYVKAASTMIPGLLVNNNLRSIQCLILFSVFFSCLAKPCQAYDFVSIASFKIQNLLGSCRFENEPEELAILRRCYWATLLIESEIIVQLNLADSGIWRLNPTVPLPVGHGCFSTASSPLQLDSPEQTVESNSSCTSDEILSYFIAAIAMRRMLQHCTLSISRGPGGKLTYAPIIASELERQLNEWYGYLPEALRFIDNAHDHQLDSRSGRKLVQADFLGAQFYAYRASIYWPATYQAMELGVADNELQIHCHRFFDSYVHFIASATAAVRTCRPNSWTLYASTFVLSMSALKAATTACLRIVIPSEMTASFQVAVGLLQAAARLSPSLALLEETFCRKYNEHRQWFPDGYIGVMSNEQ